MVNFGVEDCRGEVLGGIFILSYIMIIIFILNG